MRQKAREVFAHSLLGARHCLPSPARLRRRTRWKIGLLARWKGVRGARPGRHRGADLALAEHKGMAGGKKIEFVKVSSDATPDKAVASTARPSSRTRCRS